MIGEILDGGLINSVSLVGDSRRNSVFVER